MDETFGNRVRINESTREIYARLKHDMQQRAVEAGFVRLSGTIVTGALEAANAAKLGGQVSPPGRYVHCVRNTFSTRYR